MTAHDASWFCALALVSACGPGDDRVRADFEQRTGCAVERMKLVEKSTAKRVYEIEARCPGGQAVEQSLSGRPMSSMSGRRA